MSESIPMPELQQSDLDLATLRRLFDDVAACTELLEVVPKHAAGFVGEGQTMSAEEGFAGLVSGQLRGLQLRYLHEGQLWWDTLMASGPGTFRIVRIRHEAALH
ncbi:MAG TPA: hypothetical protein VFY13_00700 [Luteolibacter sp.]|nr:hypothetical protein [Luteolibacter sp.]